MITVYKDMGYKHCAVITNDETSVELCNFGGAAF